MTHFTIVNPSDTRSSIFSASKGPDVLGSFGLLQPLANCLKLI